MKRLGLFLFALSLALVLVACGGNQSNNEQENTSSPNDTDSSEAETIAIKHELDEEEVLVPKNPQKVAVFDISTLDTIDFLGLNDQVIGFPKATVPAYINSFDAEQYENFGSLKEPDFEKIHASQPDLIIITGRQAELYDQFKEIAPTIYLDIDTQNFLDSFDNNVKTVGSIFGKEAEVEVALEELHGKLEDIKTTVETTDENALIVLGTEGKVSAFGPASRFGIIHDVLGIKAADEKIEESSHGQSITFEYILETNPDMIFIIDRDSAIGMESSVKESFENDIVQKTNAYQHDKLIYLDGEVWYLAGGGIESLNLMIDEIASSIQ